MEITLRDNLRRLSSLFCEASDRRVTFIGAKAINDPKILNRIFNGAGFTVGTYDRLVLWLSENWPDGLEWPGDVARPESTMAGAAEAAV